MTRITGLLFASLIAQLRRLVLLQHLPVTHLVHSHTY
jgi:hypothetical protein